MSSILHDRREFASLFPGSKLRFEWTALPSSLAAIRVLA
jgi:hypothetical protein